MRVRTILSTLRAETSEAVFALGSLFGLSFFVGARSKFPRINEPMRHIQANSILNFVDCSNLSTMNYIKFRYYQVDCQVSITVVYSNLSVKSDPNLIIGSLPPNVAQ